MKTGILSRRTVMLLVALTLAGLATVSLRAYVRGIEARTLEGAELVEAFVAKEKISSGTSGADAIANGMIDKEALPRKVLAEGSITALSEIENLVAVVDIMAGEQILATRFASKGETGLGFAIPDGRHAFSVEVATPPGVAGFVRQGSRVSIIAQFEEPEPRARFLIQNIEVLAIGTQTSTTEGSGGVAERTEKVLLTLAVTPQEAEKLALAVLQGQVYFTLVRPGSDPADTPGRTLEDVFS